MESPDFSKYNEIQLKQILRRIDRERFPERVTEIEARLAKLNGFSKPQDLDADPSTFVVKPYPGVSKKVFGPAAPFIFIATILLGIGMFLDATAHPTIAGIAFPVGLVVMFIAFAILFVRLHTLACPVCQRECEKAMLTNENWGAICQHCQVHWDTGIGSD